MSGLLQECIERFKPAPRRISWWDRFTYLKLPRPKWLPKNSPDKLNTHFQRSGDLFSQGVVTWGHLIQANAHMFEDGLYDCPGEIVYSIEDGERITHEAIAGIARAIGSLKHTTPDEPQSREIADYLTNEMIRVFGLSVPRSIGGPYRCRISTTLFVRKHLPNRRICNGLFPIVVTPDAPHVVTVLPERYWPDRLRDWWTQ